MNGSGSRRTSNNKDEPEEEENPNVFVVAPSGHVTMSPKQSSKKKLNPNNLGASSHHSQQRRGGKRTSGGVGERSPTRPSAGSRKSSTKNEMDRSRKSRVSGASTYSGSGPPPPPPVYNKGPPPPPLSPKRQSSRVGKNTSPVPPKKKKSTVKSSGDSRSPPPPARKTSRVRSSASSAAGTAAEDGSASPTPGTAAATHPYDDGIKVSPNPFPKKKTSSFGSFSPKSGKSPARSRSALGGAGEDSERSSAMPNDLPFADEMDDKWEDRDGEEEEQHNDDDDAESRPAKGKKAKKKKAKKEVDGDPSALKKVKLYFQGHDLEELNKNAKANEKGGRPGLEHMPSARTSATTKTDPNEPADFQVLDKDGKKVIMVPVTEKQAKKLPSTTMSYAEAKELYGHHLLPGGIKVEEVPPKTLVFIWIIVVAELGFDLATTIIAFVKLVGSDDCCGARMDLGPLPLTVTTPFLFLIFAELSFLLRAMALTLWPSLLIRGYEDDDSDSEDEDDDEGDEENGEEGATTKKRKRPKRTRFMERVCCFFKWNAKVLLGVLNFLVVLNPFFGCVIAWMLLYQSDKSESFLVLAFEGISIILHFMSIYLEGAVTSCWAFLFHCIPVVPFFVSVTMILIYLKQGGVCYLVEEQLFLFGGCELCPDTYPPIDGMCPLPNGTLVAASGSHGVFGDISFSDINFDSDFGDIAGTLTARTYQGTYCAKPDGPNVNFCFFDYSGDD